MTEKSLLDSLLKRTAVSNVEIIIGLHETCDKEAIRLVENMPKWEPAISNGDSLRIKMIVPISFHGLK